MHKTLKWLNPAMMVVAFAAGLFAAPSAFAATITSTAAGGNWNVGGTWVGGVVPVAGDTAVIATTGAGSVQLNVTVTQTAAGAVTVNNGATLDATTAGVTATFGALTIAGGGTVTLYRPTTVLGATNITGTINFGSTDATNPLMTFTGNVTLNAGAVWNETATGNVAAFSFGGNLTNNATTFTAQNDAAAVHTFTGAARSLSGATAIAIPYVTITGTATNNGTLTVAAALSGTGGLTQGANDTLNIGGTSGITTLTATAAGNTVNYTGAAQTVHGNNYVNLILSGSGAKTLQAGTTAITGSLTLSGTATTATVTNLAITANLVVGNGTTFTAAGFNLTVTGTTTVGGGTSGDLAISSAAGTKIFVGLVTVNAGGTWTNTAANSPVTFRGGITNNGTFNAGTGVHTFDTANRALAGILSIPSVTVTGVTLTNNGTLTVGTALSGTGGLTQGANDTLNIGGTSGITTLTATAAGNTVNYTGAAQTVHGNNYVNLTLSGSGAKTLQAATTAITGSLTLSGTATTATVANLAITANLVVGDGTTFTAAGFNLTVTGATTVGGGTSGNLAISSAAGTKIFVGLVTVNAGGTWTNTAANSPVTFRGGITNNGTFNAGTGVHTFNTSNRTLTGTLSIPSVTVTGITLTNNGTLTVDTALSGTGGLTQGTNATLNIGGTSGITTMTATAVGNTVNYTGAAQTVHGNNYRNLTLSGTGTKTLQAATTAITGSLTLSGTATTTTVVGLTITTSLVIGDGTTFTAAGFALTVTGATNVGGGASGNLTISSATGTKTFVGLVTVNAGGTWTNTAANSPVTFRGGIANSGTFNAGTGVHTFNTNAQALTGAFSIPSVTVTGVTLTNNNTLTVGTALIGTGGLTQAANAILNIGGTSTITTLTASNTGNTVNYTGGAAQAIKAITYYNLAFTGAAKSATGGVTIAAGGTLDQGCTVAFTATGALTLGGSYLNCNSASAGGSGNLTVGGITVNSGGSFDFIGANSGTPTITLTGNVVNNGIVRIWGGGRDGLGSPVCPGTPLTVVTAAASRSWSGSGNFHLANLSLTNQNAAVAITAYNSTNAAGNTGSWTFTTGTCEFASPTAVKVNSFAAAQTERGVRISLQTSRDVNNLGFNLYREVKGQRVKLNASLLAGTALMGGAGTSFTAGQSRRWHDSGGHAGDVYWLEEVDLNGLKTWYGPIAAAPVHAKATAAGPGPEQALQPAHAPMAPSGAVDEELSAALTLSRVGSVRGAGNTASKALMATMAAKAAPTPRSDRQQYALAAGAAVRLGVKEEGWYRVTQPQLVAAGISPNVNPRKLQLYANGVEQPIVVDSAREGRFGAQDAIYFYGMGIDSTWSDTQAYWLVAGSDNGSRMDVRGASGGARGAASFPATVAWKPRTLYFAGLLNGDGNNFFGPVVTDVPVSQALTVSRLNGADGPSKLQVKLQGGTAGAHEVTVSLNGTVLGKAHFSGQESVVATFTVPAVNEGANVLTLVAANQDDVSAVDEVRLTYPHAYTADGDALRFTAQAYRSTRIDGFSSASITAIDITDPANPSLVRGQASGSAPNYALTVMPWGGGVRTLLAVESAQVRTPTIAANEPSSWHAAQAGHDMVILGHASLLPSAAPLAALRQSQGHKVAVIDVQDLYDEFSFGVKSPYAVREFLSVAKASWRVKPQFVLLLGNGTFDPRNYLGTSVPDLVPAKLIDTRLLETASDDWFVDFDDDGIPDMAIGRLPAESAAAANLMVGRTVAYDQSAEAAWMSRALLVSGQSQDPKDDFASLSAAVQGSLPGTIGVTHLIQDTDPNPASNLITYINAGQVLVNYIGHGSNEVWGGGLFDSAAALGLANGSMTPLFLTMTCLNGYFQDVYTAALGKALLQATGGGAVAVWASSGLSEPGPQSTMNQAMVTALYSNPAMTIGQAAAAAKAATPDLDVRRTWILLGDPSTLLQ